MVRHQWYYGLALTSLLASIQTAHALVISGPIKPGVTHFGYVCPEQEAFTELMKLHPCVGGRFIDAPTWWDGHYSATYLFRGRNADLQRQIDFLDRLKLPGTTVLLVHGEGFDEPNKFFGIKDVICYDWDLSISETRNRGGRHKLLPGMNERQIRLVVHLGSRLDRNQLRVPEWMTPKPVKMEGLPILPGTVEYSPADALHALARAARDD